MKRITIELEDDVAEALALSADDDMRGVGPQAAFLLRGHFRSSSHGPNGDGVCQCPADASKSRTRATWVTNHKAAAAGKRDRLRKHLAKSGGAK